MIDLLREQLYQQQLSLSRDVSFDEDDLDLSVQSPASSIPSVSMSEPILADVSNQMADIKQTLMRTQLQHQKDLSKSFSDVSSLVIYAVNVLKSQTLCSIHFFLPKFCFLCSCFLKHLVELQTV